MPLQTVNPATGEFVREFPTMEITEILRVLEAVETDATQWRGFSFRERAECFQRVAQILRENQEAYAKTITLEMGKPIAESKAECEKCAWVCEYYADNGERFLADIPIEDAPGEALVHHEPLGAVLAIMPWNFPFWQVFRAAAPAMMAGNAMVLKHSSNVPQCALSLEAIFQQAGFPMNVFRTLMVGSEGAAVAIAHPAIHAVTLTGSTAAGEKVAAMAGSQIKKTVLELGGSDPYLVFEDADIGLAVEKIVASRMINGGQSCVAAKRAIVLPGIKSEFETKVSQAMAAITPGDPTDTATKLGPLARADLRDELHQQVTNSIAAGARCLTGGAIPDRPGAWYPATALTDVTDQCPAFSEELFGPVLTIIEASDEEEAVNIANSSEYGLGAAVFTKNKERARRLAVDRLQSGAVFVNDYVKSDPRMPFGGVKRSGYGRELASQGIKEFVNVKTVVIN
ncbi:MAG: NAD-dependent succinate-semialdehyde dehydrogenase [Verrucomicrobiota bacterium]